MSGDEPWIIGHVLLGIARSPNRGDLYFLDKEFNSQLLDWYSNLEWRPGSGGWADVPDTAFTLIGLVNYYLEREAFVRGGGPELRPELTREISSRIDFRFENRGSRRMVVYPVWNQRSFAPLRDECFVIMPFKARWSDAVYQTLQEVLKECDLVASRGDSTQGADIMEDIWRGLNECKMVIAECTGRNKNVFYELGVAHTLGKDVILLTQKESDVPFDVASRRYILYKDDAEGHQILRKEIPKYINSILRYSGLVS